MELTYDATVAEEKGGRPFGIEALRPIQLSKRGMLEDLAAGRRAFATEQWKHLLLRSVGFEPASLSQRAQDILLLRMVPFVDRNYNMVELGPRGTGKSHLFQQISPASHLISGGKATVARMFVNNASGQRGLVAQYDVICFDEISGVSFDQKDGVNIMKGYMESGEFSRGRESIRANGSLVFVGNFEVDVEHQQRIGHLLEPLPPEMRHGHRLHGSHPCLSARLGRSEARPVVFHGPLRPGERLPLRLLVPIAVGEQAVLHSGASPVWWCPQRARYDGSAPDGRRPPETSLP